MATTASKKNTKKGKLNFDKQQYIDWFTMMYRIRRFEQMALMSYGQGKIRGFCHVYIGQEAVAAGVMSGLRKEDKLISGYRIHGIALARGLDANSCMAELYGKKTGCVQGKGGSMHYFSKEHNLFGGNGIVGAQIPIGTGMAFAEKYRGSDNISVCMFGDGAARQGALHESFNMAMTWQLPVLYIVENNGYAMGTSVERTSNVPELYKIGQAYNMPSKPVNGMDAEEVHNAIVEAAEHIRAGNGPYFLEINTYRYRGHSTSDPALYRTKEEVEEYMKRDAILTIEKRMIDNKMATQKELDAIKKTIDEEIEEAVEFADKSEFPAPEELYDHNYTQVDYPFIRD